MILWFFYVCGLEEIIDNHNEFEAHVKILGNNVFLFHTMHKAYPDEAAFDKAKACCELANRVDDEAEDDGEEEDPTDAEDGSHGTREAPRGIVHGAWIRQQ